MDRADKIATRGWLGSSISIMTFGYFDGASLAYGKLCAIISLSAPGASLALSLPGVNLALSLPGIDVGLSLPGIDIDLSAPGATIGLQDCSND